MSYLKSKSMFMWDLEEKIDFVILIEVPPELNYSNFSKNGTDAQVL